MSEPKTIRLTAHARAQAELRGATAEEITQTIREGEWEAAKRGKQQTRRHFAYDKASPVNQQVYRFKTIEAIFVDEPEAIVVVTVKVYYSNEEQAQ